jgi:hypothetical protein
MVMVGVGASGSLRTRSVFGPTNSIEVFGSGAAAVRKLAITIVKQSTQKNLFILASLVQCSLSAQQNLILEYPFSVPHYFIVEYSQNVWVEICTGMLKSPTLVATFRVT